ncbi:MAG: phosphoenolpyruvate synthase [Barrevirus sp.]|uniref:pyruvate, water dikinase n=1 Tax=Barrevirus sp. TaxID=2487763 RepID=A0A3G4ZQ61_9VIRU|nr:MAG: phosphoenolpyruvate synthase [Barrevirus sp.]
MCDIGLVGGKCASLGEMIGNIPNIQIPDGFAITVAAFSEFISYNDLDTKINDLILGLKDDDLINLRTIGSEIRALIKNGTYPVQLENEIINNYTLLSKNYEKVENVYTDVAVRSSSTAEDLQDASFAGQQETYLNVKGINQILESIKNCFASLYTDRAISYRRSINYNSTLKICVCIQKMVRSDLGSAGVAFSIDPESGFKDLIVINGAYGLGELVVSGAIKPDEILIHKKTLELGYKSIIDKKLGDKKNKMIYGSNDNENKKTEVVEVLSDKYDEFCISDDQSLKLGRWIIEIENYYTTLNNQWTPVDIEWAIDGLTDELYIVQARPETIHSNNRKSTVIKEYKINKDSTTLPIVQGIAVGDKVGTGRVRIVHSLDNLDFQKGDILVTEMTDPAWEPLMVQAGAIITNNGSRTCHAAIISRELGICAVVGSGNCTQVLKDGQLVTISCAEGDIGLVYDGLIPYEIKEMDLATLPKIKTKVMFNIASPTDVFKYHNYPCEGVGLVREEFIINSFIKVHPMALINYDTLEPKLKEEIQILTKGYKDVKEYYVEKLSFGLARIASTFYPKDVIVRFSDFKTNEYKNLLGGFNYEKDEENPMIGKRGSSRYYDKSFKEAFGLECLAIKRLRNELGLKNVIVMIPFCRTVTECIKVQEVMKEYGLERGVNGLQVYLMCEIPSNVILADTFCKYVDGFSIGSNDLTQLTLGLDRDNALIADIFDERNEAVKIMISMAIKACKRNGVKIGICGQGPSDYPNFAEFLVKEGIDSISLTPDSIFKTIMHLSQI